MEIFIITATNPRDRDLILGLVYGIRKLTYTDRSNGQRNKHQIWKKRTGAHRTTDEKW
jgi:hypothetical protein